MGEDTNLEEILGRLLEKPKRVRATVDPPTATRDETRAKQVEAFYNARLEGIILELKATRAKADEFPELKEICELIDQLEVQ